LSFVIFLLLTRKFRFGIQDIHRKKTPVATVISLQVTFVHLLSKCAKYNSLNPKSSGEEKPSVVSVLSVETAYELTPGKEQKAKSAQNRFPEATAISHIKRQTVTINHNRIAIYYFRSIAIKRQSERRPKIQFFGSAIEN
jgi:hypothetical protein